MIAVALVPKYAMRNKANISVSPSAGCYYCCKIYKSEEIKEYTDQGETALCPHCNVDAVLPGGCGIELTEETLKQIHNYWFN